MTTLAEALAPRSDQLNSDDLIPGPRILKITGARIIKDGRDIKIVLNYDGDNGKPWKPCRTMGRAMVLAWSITNESQMIGKSIRVYRDPEVKFGDQGAVGGIRVSHMSDIAKTVKLKLTVSQGKKGDFIFNPLLNEVEAAPAEEDHAAKADRYVAQIIIGITSAADLAALDGYIAQRLIKITSLQKDFPELYQRIDDTLRLRREEFGNVVTDDDLAL